MSEATLHTYTEPQAKLSPSALHFKIEHNSLSRRVNLYGQLQFPRKETLSELGRGIKCGEVNHCSSRPKPFRLLSCFRDKNSRRFYDTMKQEWRIAR
jgi:hypothetical protein